MHKGASVRFGKQKWLRSWIAPRNGEPTAWRLGCEAFSPRPPKPHAAQAALAEDGGAGEDFRPKAKKHAPACGLQVGAKPGAPRLRGYPRLLGAPRLARMRPAAGKRSAPTATGMRSISGGGKRWVAAQRRRTRQGMIRAAGRPARKFPRSRALARFAKQREMVPKQHAQPERAEAFDFDFVLFSVLQKTETLQRNKQNGQQ